MDEEPERTKRWEGGYERTWEILKEDESGSLKATVEEILFQSKRDRIIKSCGQIRLGMMRHLFLVIDCSRSMEDQDLKPNRLTATLKLMEAFIEEYFDQNPISQVGIIFTKNKRAEKLTDLSGFPQHTFSSSTDQNAKPSFSMALLDGTNDPGLSLGGYLCPQCHAKYLELPVECKVCGLTLVSAPHLARSFHHLFPLHVFIETPVENTPEKRFCESCQGELKDKRMFTCPSCRRAFCVDCDHFIHDTLHCCPGCVHCQRTP
ncbi:general transcription factor IIH subunit 2 isoform X3 [Syngnathus scovelli]|uniref:general transcription factor IIH subunit 2 isoform X3 n=1 Tax=Syngnathus scovelli TaxID=161590 RepID=UPI002110A4F4|nr:general transcription factor IIH subunit 2 isoform X3 [Syngnathus scovelli]